MIINIRHTGIVVRNMQLSLKFYSTLGFRVYKETDEPIDFISEISGKKLTSLKTIKLSAPQGNMIELLEYGSLETVLEKYPNLCRVGPAHIAFTVKNLDAVYQKLIQEGINFISMPQCSPDGQAYLVFCQAPEGTFIELVEEL